MCIRDRCLDSRFVDNGTQLWWTVALLIFSDGQLHNYYMEMINDFNEQFLCTWTLCNFIYEWQPSVRIERQSTSQLSSLASNYLGLYQTTSRSITPKCCDITTCQSTCRFDHTLPPVASGNAISENTPLHLRMAMSSAVNHPSLPQSTVPRRDSVLRLALFVARNMSNVNGCPEFCPKIVHA